MRHSCIRKFCIALDALVWPIALKKHQPRHGMDKCLHTLGMNAGPIVHCRRRIPMSNVARGLVSAAATKDVVNAALRVVPTLSFTDLAEQPARIRVLEVRRPPSEHRNDC